MPELPQELKDDAGALYIYNAQQCGLTISDLQCLTYEQVMHVMELHDFVNDAVAYEDDDKAASEGEAFFFG